MGIQVDQNNCSDASQWPRDFDFRAQYAEQQELLIDAHESAAIPNQSSGAESHD